MTGWGLNLTQLGGCVKRTLALIGFVVGMLIYATGFLIDEPTPVCVSQPEDLIPPTILTESAFVTALPDAQTIWVGIVASRCSLIFPTGAEASTIVIAWGPSLVAITGVVVAATSLTLCLTARRQMDYRVTKTSSLPG